MQHIANYDMVLFDLTPNPNVINCEDSIESKVFKSVTEQRSASTLNLKTKLISSLWQQRIIYILLIFSFQLTGFHLQTAT